MAVVVLVAVGVGVGAAVAVAVAVVVVLVVSVVAVCCCGGVVGAAVGGVVGSAEIVHRWGEFGHDDETVWSMSLDEFKKGHRLPMKAL